MYCLYQTAPLFPASVCAYPHPVVCFGFPAAAVLPSAAVILLYRRHYRPDGSLPPCLVRPDHCVVLKGPGSVAPSASTPTSATKERRPRGSFGATERAPVGACGPVVRLFSVIIFALFFSPPPGNSRKSGPGSNSSRPPRAPQPNYLRCVPSFSSRDKVQPFLCSLVNSRRYCCMYVYTCIRRPCTRVGRLLIVELTARADLGAWGWALDTCSGSYNLLAVLIW